MRHDADPADVRGPAHTLLSAVVRTLLAINALIGARVQRRARRPGVVAAPEHGAALDR